MSDTPETDAFFMREDIDWDMEYDLCRKLERERNEWKEVAEGSLLGAIHERDALRNELNFTIRLLRTWENDVERISADRDYWKLEAEQWREINK